MPRQSVAASNGMPATSSFDRSGTSTSRTAAAAGTTTKRVRKSIVSAPDPEVGEDRHDAEQGQRDVAVQVAVEQEAYESAQPLREGADPVDDRLHEDVLLEEGARVGEP